MHCCLLVSLMRCACALSALARVQCTHVRRHPLRGRADTRDNTIRPPPFGPLEKPQPPPVRRLRQLRPHTVPPCAHTLPTPPSSAAPLCGHPVVIPNPEAAPRAASQQQPVPCSPVPPTNASATLPLLATSTPRPSNSLDLVDWQTSCGMSSYRLTPSTPRRRRQP